MGIFYRIMITCVVIGAYTLGETSLASELGLDIAGTSVKGENQKEFYQKEQSDEQMEENQSEAQSSMDLIKETFVFEDPYYRLGQSITTNLWPWFDQVPSPANMTYQLWEGSLSYSFALRNSIYYTFIPKFDNIVLDY